MKRIMDYVDAIHEELCDAKHYAEEALYFKASGKQQEARWYAEMANDELRHADHIHSMAVDEINILEGTYKPTQEMIDKWQHSHAEYVEKTAWVKQMLAM